MPSGSPPVRRRIANLPLSDGRESSRSAGLRVDAGRSALRPAAAPAHGSTAATLSHKRSFLEAESAVPDSTAAYADIIDDPSWTARLGKLQPKQLAQMLSDDRCAVANQPIGL